jgi:hypothetical protein
MATRVYYREDDEMTELETAIRTLVNALKADPKYRDTWAANIAMSFYDAYALNTGNPPDIHEIANSGANRFLGLLCAYDFTGTGNGAKDNIKEEERYWQKLTCEICRKHIGWAPFFRSAYQCTDCNKIPANWDTSKYWLERYNSAEGANYGT